MTVLQHVFSNFRNIYTAVFAANIMGICSDATLTWSSPVLIKLNQTGGDNPFGDPITDRQASWIGSFNTMGAIFGPLPCMLAADKFGRKSLLLLMAVPHIVSLFLLAFSTNMSVYYVARFMGGFAVGSSYTILPIYIGEVTENSNRGMFGASMNVFCATGDLLSYSIGPYISLLRFNVTMAMFPVAFLILFAILSPESPYYLTAQNKEEEAKRALAQLRHTSSEKAIEEEMKAIRVCVENDMKGHFTDVFKSKYLLKALLISVSLLSFQQLSGIFAVMYYTQTIFEASGTVLSSDVSSIIVGVVLLLGTFVTPGIVDRLGRRVLLLFSAIGMIISESALATYFVLMENTTTDLSAVTWLPILSLVLYIFSHNTGFGILPLTVMSEIFPSNVKSVASSITSMVGYGLGFLITNFFNDISNAIGIGGSFFLFVGFNIMAVLFVVFVVPETNGKSFDEIQNILKGIKSSD